MVILSIFSCLCWLACLSKTFKIDNHQAAILGYLIIFFVYYLFGVLAFFLFSRFFVKHINFLIGCPEDDEPGAEACYAVSIIFRVAASLFIFYLIICLLMLFKDDFSYRVNKHLWLVKWVFPLILIIAFCFIPNDIFDWFSLFSKIFGMFYLIAQDLSFGEFFFRWSNYWTLKNNGCYNIVMYVTSGIVSIATLALVAANFYFHFKWACWHNIIFLFSNIIVLIVYIILTAI